MNMEKTTGEIKSYSEVEKHLKSRQKHLLLGNGFSRSFDDGIFSYNALSEFIHKLPDNDLHKLLKL